MSAAQLILLDKRRHQNYTTTNLQCT